MVKDLLRNPEPSIDEFIFMLFVTLAFTLFITFIDMMIHDGYVRPVIAECYKTNTIQFCEQRRHELLDQSPIMAAINDMFLNQQNEQIQLGGNYWFALLVIVLFVAGVVGIARIVLGKLAGADTNPMLFIIGGLWSYSIVSLYYFGWLDYLYFALRKIQMPLELPWLNGVGFFGYVQKFGNTQNVDVTDLYLLMGIGLMLFVGIWAVLIHHHKKGTLERLGLI